MRTRATEIKRKGGGMKRAYKIVNDGSLTGTRVYDLNGEDISDFVTAITWKHKAGALPSCAITFLADVVVMDAEVYREQVSRRPDFVDNTPISSKVKSRMVKYKPSHVPR